MYKANYFFDHLIAISHRTLSTTRSADATIVSLFIFVDFGLKVENEA